MYWLVSLLMFETIVEGLLCGDVIGRGRVRKACCLAAACVLLVVAVGLCIRAWQVWVWTLPITAYRLLNLLRVYRQRLPPAHLRTVTVRAFSWLAAVQLPVVLAAWAVSHYHLGLLLLNLLAAAQLLCAVTLLRASTHTWRHAHVSPVATALSDHELPTLSVLVPARNETDALQRCLEALIASDYPKLEILVLDDCSASRRTPDIIRSFAHDGVRFIKGEVPDETRWLAKNYAYEQLAAAASAEILLFCGVDALVEPHSLRQLVGLMLTRQKDMISVMPLRAATGGRKNALLQSMRYYWEICLPRRFFKRPPVLSTCWLIRRTALARMGGFEAVSRSVSPEAPFARQAVVTDGYSFLRSDEELGIYSDKSAAEQYGTSLRVRYPQLHRRLELVVLISAFEVVFLLGPFIGLLLVWALPQTMAYIAVWIVSLFCLFTTYAIVAVGSRLANPWYGWLLMPAAFVADLVVLHVSLWKYEFSSVDWKGRNVCIPVMRVEPRPGISN